MKALHSASGTGIGYNPGITYRGGEFLAQGIAQAGNAVAEGLAQFQKNREERDFLDESMKSRVAALRQFQDFEKAANEDDTSPAGQLLKTFANWDNKSLSAKKAALMDADLLVNKREQEAQRTRAEQWHLLAEQRAQEGLELQRQNLGLAKGQAGVQAMTALANLYNQVKDNARADAYLALSRLGFELQKKTHEDSANRLAAQDRKAAEMDARLAEFSRLARPQPTGPSPMMGAAAEWLNSAPGTAAPNWLQLDATPTLRSRTPQELRDLALQTRAWEHPHYDDMLKALGGGRNDPKPYPFTNPVTGENYTVLGASFLASPTREEREARAAIQEAAKRFPEGTRIEVANGVRRAIYPDGTWKTLPKPSDLEVIMGGGGGNTAPSAPKLPVPASAGAKLTLEQAEQFRTAAGGDVAKAREMARKAGFTF
jgi:hypothetical protein